MQPFARTARSALSEFADLPGLEIVRDGRFTWPAKILTPLDDLLVPLIRAEAAADLTAREGISGVVATPELAGLVPDHMALGLSPRPLETLDAIHRRLAGTPGRLWTDVETRISPTATVHPSAVVASRTAAVLDHAEIMALAVVGARTVVGEHSRIHPHASVGAEAYEIVRVDGLQRLRPQTGGTVIGRRCEILGGVVISSSAFGGATEIGDHVVLDGNVVVSHDARIGDGTRVGGGSWIGGRVRIGRDVSMGPGCIVANGLSIGDGAKLSLGAVVTRDVAPGEQVSGNFAIPHARFLEHLRSIR